ncbi:MAG: hypothetical protein ACYCV7_09135 [Acidimicrobiales bacterium]
MRDRWFSARAMLFHLLVAIIVPGCLIAWWWQVHVALSGNVLAWAYAVEWPIFAVIAVVGWWHLIHEDPADAAARRRGPSGRGLAPSSGPAATGPSRQSGANEMVAEPGSATPSPDAWRAARAAATAAAYALYLEGITDGQ